MAGNAHHHDHSAAGGGMDISEHVKTWNSFWEVSKWGSIAILVLGALLFVFRAHNGY